MHWVWTNDPSADDEAPAYAPLYAPSHLTELDAEFDTGAVVSVTVPLVPIDRDAAAKGTLADNVLLRGGGGLLFSSRLRQALATIPLDNVQYYPAVVRNAADGTSSDDYHVANIVGRVACL